MVGEIKPDDRISLTWAHSSLAESVEAKTPIDEGVVVIDDHHPLKFESSGFLGFDEFRYSALRLDRGSTFGANYAQRYAILYLIKSWGLKILAPGDGRAGEKPWGPYDPDDYFIDAEAFITAANEIETFASTHTHYSKVIDVLHGVTAAAQKLVKDDTDKISDAMLPGAFTTDTVPTKRIKNGRVIAFEDFQKAIYALNTSPGKVSSVFDRLVWLLGDDEARQRIGMLSGHANPYSRKWIRATCYFQTQSLYDLLGNLDGLSAEDRKVINRLGVRVLRYVLTDQAEDEFDNREDSSGESF